MSSACPALPAAPFYDPAALLPTNGLEGWQRFLQSEPLVNQLPDQSDEVGSSWAEDTSVSVFEPIFQTLHGLTHKRLMVGLIATGTIGSVALMAFDQLATVPPAPDCAQLPQVVPLRDQLTCLQSAIAMGDQQARQQGLAWIGNWQSSEPLFTEGQDLLEQWSWSVIQDARRAQTEQDWATAIDLVTQVPPSSPRFEEAQTLLAHLQQHRWEVAQDLNATAQAALKTADWATAYQSLNQLAALDHPAAPLALRHQLARQISAERRAVQLWNQAQRTWSSGTASEQASAIAIASQISPTTYQWQIVQPQINQWSDQLLPLVRTQLSQGDWRGAIALAETIAQNPHREASVQPWLALARTQQLTVLSTAATSKLAHRVGWPAAVLASQSLSSEEVLGPPEIARNDDWQMLRSQGRSPKTATMLVASSTCTKTETDRHDDGPPNYWQPIQPLLPEQRCQPQFGPSASNVTR